MPEKKLIFCIVLAIVFLCGCDDCCKESSSAPLAGRSSNSNSSDRIKICEEKDLGFYGSISVVEFGGHTYIVLHGPRVGHMLHAASCPCMQQRKGNRNE